MNPADLTPPEQAFLLELVAQALSAQPFADEFTLLGVCLTRAETRTVERQLLHLRKARRLAAAAASAAAAPAQRTAA